MASDLIEKVLNEKFSYPLQPGGYEEIDIDADLRIDFINSIEQGISLKFSKEKFNNIFSIEGGTNPRFLEAQILNHTFQNHHFNISFGANQALGLGYQLLPIRGISAKFDVDTRVNMKEGINSQVIITHEGNRSHLDIKAMDMMLGGTNHRLVGLSYARSLRSWLTLGGEVYYKFIQNSPGASFGARVRGEMAGLQYSLVSTYGIMGDLKFSTTVGIIPKILSISTRFNINTSSMQSNTQFAVRLASKPKINGFKVPLCLKVRCDNNFESAINFELDTPAVKIGIGCFGHKLNLFNNLGIRFEI